MFGLNDILLGGVVPLVAAASAFAIGWAASRRPSLAWSLGVIVGYAGGVVALEARGAGLLTAVKHLTIPAEAKHWTPLLALLAALPAIASAVLGKSRWVHWLLAGLVCVAAPVWLLWGSSYLPTPEVRASGFAKNAWNFSEAAFILSLLSIALSAAWLLWEQADRAISPKLRAFLASLTLAAAAVTAGLTGSFVYAQLFGALAASVGGCFLASFAVQAPSGPESAAGPIIVLANCLLLLAVSYSALDPWLAAGVYVSIVVAAGWLPGLGRLRNTTQIVGRAVLCAAPLALVLWQAAGDFFETQQQQQKAAESNPYLNL